MNIGAVSFEALASIQDSITKLYPDSGNLNGFTELYVKDIITIMPDRLTDNANDMFKKSGFWLGVGLTGFAKVVWE